MSPSVPQPSGNSPKDHIAMLLDRIGQGHAYVTSWEIQSDYYTRGTIYRFEILLDPLQSGRPHVHMGSPPPQIVYANTTAPFIMPKSDEDEPVEVEDIGTSIEPIVGWRDFEFTTDFMLESRNGTEWKPYEPLRAWCGGPTERDSLPKHDSPAEDCGCGIYATTTDEHDCLDKSQCWGEVYLWGDVLICESGYRAQFAYPKHLYLRNNGTKYLLWLKSHLEENYGVPVDIVEGGE